MDTNEDKNLICALLLMVCKATRGAGDLMSLVYDEGKETVTATFANGGKRKINVEMDSGTAMIRDIMNGLGC